MERIIGPYSGYYIATYASESAGPERAWIGYAKICRHRPDSYWEAEGCAKVSALRERASAGEAVADAERQARQQIGNLVPTRRFTGFSIRVPAL
jgi:hypothetical protein